MAYLREREQVTAVYLERRVRARLDDGDPRGGEVTALTYAVDRSHPQYAGALGEEEVLRLVRQGVGRSGANPDYVRATHEHLAAIGVRDPLLARLAERLGGGEGAA